MIDYLYNNQMKEHNMRYAFIGIIFLNLFLLTCVTAKENPDKNKRINWRYEIETTAAGTRSEGQIGHLFYGENEIGPVFNILVVKKTVYEFLVRENAWDFGGYKKISDSSYTPVACDTKIKESELKQGWYLSSITCKKHGTPADWIWIKRKDLEAFVSPDKIGFVITHFKLNPMTGRLMFDFDKEK